MPNFEDRERIDMTAILSNTALSRLFPQSGSVEDNNIMSNLAKEFAHLTPEQAAHANEEILAGYRRSQFKLIK
jgi:hypothetical protein